MVNVLKFPSQIPFLFSNKVLVPDPVVQSIASLIAESGVVSLIPAPAHTFMEIDLEIFSSIHIFKKSCCQLQEKVCAQSTS